MKWHLLENTENNWIFIVFLIGFSLITFIKLNLTPQFQEFLKLPINNKYILIYGKKEKVRFIFIFLFSFLQWISVSVLLYFLLKFYGFSLEKWSIPDVFFIAFVFLGVQIFFWLKLGIQYFVMYVFNLEEFAKNFIFIRLTYSNYAGFVLFFLNIFAFYGLAANRMFFYYSAFCFISILFLGGITFYKLHQKRIKSYFFYFILYLCTLEIAPFLFVAFLLKN